MALPLSTSGVTVVTTGSPYRTVLRLATPTVIAMLAQSLVNEIDLIFLSWLPSPESSNAQAALLPSLILLWLFGGSLSAISVGTQAIAARRFAEKHPLDAGAVLVNSWIFSLTAGAAFTALGYLVVPHVLALLIEVDEVRAAAQAYLNWRLLGITSMAMTFSFKAFFDGIGKTHVHMVSSVVMNVLNIVLCMIFIFGRFGAPRMGVAGAGFAAFVSTWVGLLIMIGWALLPRYKRVHEPFALRRWSRELTSRLLRLSIPSGVATIAVMSGFALFAMIVSRLDAGSHSEMAAATSSGGASEAVNSAATTLIVGVLKLTFTACLAFGTSTATLVSQSLGEGKPEQATRFGWVSVQTGLVLFGILGVLEGLVFTRQILSIFTQSPAVLEAALGPMRLMGLCTPLIATGMILTQALFGAGNTKFVMIVELLLHFLCLVPLAWLLGIKLGFGLWGIWSAAGVYVLLLAGIMLYKFASGDWRGIRI
jgi:multidrug resistance protein, MATE family